MSLSERWRQAALEPYTDAPTTTDEWLRALEIGADAAVRVVLVELREFVSLAPKRETTGERLSATEMAVAILNWIDKRLEEENADA